MAHIVWTPDLDTNIEVIDKQHRRIVDYINALDDAIESGDRSRVRQVLDQLVDYTLSHFAFEESLMEDAGYRFLNAHRRVHEVFTKRVADYQRRFADGEDIAPELQKTLQTWLINHIRNDDNDYADTVRANMGGTEHKSEPGWLKRRLSRIFRSR
ncbi:MAG: bacteriohemerythrin [Wenzhouxiangella sp.]|nr:MAG: bacteriohemerythrin [Wenzhouxiangella sp.]